MFAIPISALLCISWKFVIFSQLSSNHAPVFYVLLFKQILDELIFFLSKGTIISHQIKYINLHKSNYPFSSSLELLSKPKSFLSCPFHSCLIGGIIFLYILELLIILRTFLILKLFKIDCLAVEVHRWVR